MTNEPLVVSVATKRNQFVKDFEYTVKKGGYDYMLLGLGKKWEGVVTKIHVYYDFCQKFKDQSTVAIICDSYDLLFIQDRKFLLKKYYELATNKVLLGVENCCGLPSCDPAFHNQCNLKNPYISKYKYINAGFIMGPIFLLHQIFKYQKNNGVQDDQIGLNKWASKNCDKIVLDYNLEIICNVLPQRKYCPFRFEKCLTYSLPVQIKNNIIYVGNKKAAVVHIVSLDNDLGKRSEYIRNFLIPNRNQPKNRKFYFTLMYNKICTTRFYYVGYWGPVLVVSLLILLIFL